MIPDSSIIASLGGEIFDLVMVIELQETILIELNVEDFLNDDAPLIETVSRP